MQYNNVQVSGCPVEFRVKRDVSKVRLVTQSDTYKVGTHIPILVQSDTTDDNLVTMEIRNEADDIKTLSCVYEDGHYKSDFQPKNVGQYLNSFHIFSVGDFYAIFESQSKERFDPVV